MLRRLLLVLLALLLVSPPAAAQEANVKTIEGPGASEKTTLMASPRPLTEEISARAVGVKAPNGTRWALTLIGIGSADSLKLTMGDQTLPIEDIRRPDKGEVGPTRLYVSQKTFLTIAETSTVQLRVDSVKTGFPEQMRKEMQLIFERVV
ncbi:MAG: hypothetical protein ABEL04_04040 [Salinibacter sp.]|uniref:hypothetical protein n=1 Tax=Salinibacter sp. TaxID=2065818 RepID=UPI0035D442DA